MSPENTTDSLGDEIQKLEQKVHAELNSRQQALRAAKFVSLLLGCTVICFIFLNYLHFRLNWTEENFRHSLEQELKEFSPYAMREIDAMGHDLLPVYAEESRRQLMELMPEISRTVQQEMDELSNDLLKRIDSRLQKTQENVLASTEMVLFENYPDLRGPAERERLGQVFRASTEDAVLAAVTDFNSRFSKDLDEVKKTLFKFDVKDPNEDTVELQKKFLRLWLRLLDQEIMAL